MCSRKRCPMYDYANILFFGACNSSCYGCIGNNTTLQGHQFQRYPTTLDTFPPTNFDSLLSLVNEHHIPDIAFTGINTDPQLYRHESQLIIHTRKQTQAHLSLHTNGLLALEKMDEFNSYDKASISFPSFDPATYGKITGVRQPDLRKILKWAKIPIKLSMLVTPFNEGEITAYIDGCRNLGIRRVVIRKLKGREEEFPVETQPPFKDAIPKKTVFGWPVYDFDGVETTLCSFDTSTARGLFLFPDGRLEDRLI